MCCCTRNWYKGIILIILGVLFLLGTLGVLDFAFLKWWPLFLILFGIKMFFPCECKK